MPYLLDKEDLRNPVFAEKDIKESMCVRGRLLREIFVHFEITHEEVLDLITRYYVMQDVPDKTEAVQQAVRHFRRFALALRISPMAMTTIFSDLGFKIREHTVSGLTIHVVATHPDGRHQAFNVTYADLIPYNQKGPPRFNTILFHPI